MITVLSLIIGIFGFIATLVGAYFTYISFVNPIIRLKKYLKKPQNWEKFQGTEAYLSIYRHKKHQEFEIIIDWDKPVVKNYQEEWIKDYPDKEHNASYFVRLEAKGMLLMKELFISLDGGRIFVPMPRMRFRNSEAEYWYETIQIQLANILGEYSYERSGAKNIEGFASQQKKQILIKNE